MSRPSFRERKYLIDRHSQLNRREPTPDVIADALHPVFAVDHMFAPKWQTQLTFHMNGGPFSDKSFTGEELKTWLSGKYLLRGGKEQPVVLQGAMVGLGAFVLSARYTVEGREAFSYKPYGSLILVVMLEGATREIRCGFLPKRAKRR